MCAEAPPSGLAQGYTLLIATGRGDTAPLRPCMDLRPKAGGTALGLRKLKPQGCQFFGAGGSITETACPCTGASSGRAPRGKAYVRTGHKGRRPGPNEG